MFRFIAKFPKIKLIGNKDNSKVDKKDLFKKFTIFWCIYININLYTKKYKFKQLCVNLTMKFAPVAQLDRALGYGPGGSGFKS